jgi:hypothetical protein
MRVLGDVVGSAHGTRPRAWFTVHPLSVSGRLSPTPECIVVVRMLSYLPSLGHWHVAGRLRLAPPRLVFVFAGVHMRGGVDVPGRILVPAGGSYGKSRMGGDSQPPLQTHMLSRQTAYSGE